MLWWRSWPIYNLSSHLTIRIPRAPLCQYRPSLQSGRLHSSSPDSRSFDFRELNTSSAHRPNQHTGRQSRAEADARAITQVDHGHPRKSPETWIDPNSLADSLEAHREANRSGIARDGVPVSHTNRKKHHHLGTRRLLLPQYGFKRLTSANIIGKTAKGQTSYGGICPPLASEWLPTHLVPSQLRMPWMTFVTSSDHALKPVSASSRLSEEVKACETYFAPAREERKAAMHTFEHIKNIVACFAEPDSRIDLIGSRAAGTDGPVSDLDINLALRTSEESGHHPRFLRERLHRLFRAIRAVQTEHELLMHTFIDRTKVPVVVGTHLPSGLEFQIQSATGNYDTLQVAQAFLAEWPAALGLFYVLRQMLNVRGLTKGVHGGLTSYPLLNMIVAALKLGGPQVQFDEMGAQLLYCLDFWSSINFDKQKISLVEGNGESIDPISAIPRILTKDSATGDHSYLMVLDDPADPANDLGKNIRQIKHVQACFIMARQKIDSVMQSWDNLATQGGLQQTNLSILEWCLAADYSGFEEARQQLRRYSQQIA